ncbi:MAG: carboxypeptidase-like regulatory domain-containing protein [Flavobacteriia bacterium]|nr:carboxypeptidase-like regulatory domain-containing protein [Flavobacteriia bacterium]
MRRSTVYLTLLFVAFSICSFAQSIKGIVVDDETGNSIPYAAIIINDQNRGTTADADGKFEITSVDGIEYFRVRAFGYTSKRFNYSGENEVTFELRSSDNVIGEVEVLAGENPLHRIIRKVIENRDYNNPTSLDAFSYETYSKFVFTLVSDSLAPDFDTIYAPIDTANPDLGVNRDSIVKIDSSGYFTRQFMESQHLFLMESVTERKYASPRDNERVLATRISGLQTPLFVLLSNEMQSFSFYDNYIKILGSDRVNPVAPGAIGRYVYSPLDTILEGQDTVFVIQYFPEPGHSFKGIDGELYITTDNWAVRRVIAHPTGQDILGIDLGDDGVFGVEIQQFYEKKSNRWFPRELQMDFRRFEADDNGVSSAVAISTSGGSELVGIGRTKLQNIQINPELRSRDIHRISVEIDPNAADRDEEFWNRYRGESLTKKETRTYEVLDSIGEEFQIDQRLKWVLALSTGKIRWGYFDFNIDQLMRYNVYEGFRLGVGLQTSPKLSEHFSIGGKVAYGFGDEVWKYGYFGEIYFDRVSETKLYGGYEFDIYETGGTRFNLQRKTIFTNSDYRFIFIPTFDEISDVYFGFSHRIWPNWRADLSFHRQNRFTSGDYQYVYNTGDADIALNGFNVAYARLEMEYAPNDRYISGPFGLRALETTYPRFRIAYEESFDGVFDRSFPFRRIDVKAAHQIKRVYTGTTTFTLTGSYVQGDVPYSFLAGPDANASGPLGTFDLGNSLATLRGFETMPFNTFAANQYVALDVRHSFEDRLLDLWGWKPVIDIMYRSTYGALENPDRHLGLDLQGFENIYHEAGLEVNRIFGGLGLGFYQRFGPYYVGDYSDNFALKLSLRTAF